MQHRRLAALGAVVAAAVVPATALGAGSMTLHANLTGKAERPAGAPGGSGRAALTLTAGKVCWQFTLKGVTAPNAAHIHKGGPGVAGPVVVPLGATFRARGCAPAPAAMIRSIEAKPGSYYVNVHNAKYAGGAVRGQLSAM